MFFVVNLRLFYCALSQVPLVSGVDVWLAALLKSINESLQSFIVNCIQDIDSGHSIEEWILKVCPWALRMLRVFSDTREANSDMPICIKCRKKSVALSGI